ncbi:MAG: hypothetical protein WBB69_08145 [Anaerolineales bacterium]
MTNQNTPQKLSLGLGILNFTGLGLGYLYQKQWRRWGIHFLVTIILITTAFLTNASKQPIIWLPVFGLWLCWMAFDGWRTHQQPGPKDYLFSLQLPENRQWLILAVPAILLVLIAAGLMGYITMGGKEFKLGQQAYQEADCESAVEHFNKVTSIYELTFSSQISAADDRLLECDVLLSANQAYQEGDFADAIQSYQGYLEIDSDFELTTYAEEALAASYYGWAMALIADHDYVGAIEKLLVILDDYPDTSAVEQVAEPLAESYLSYSAQLWDAGDFGEAVDTALIPLNQYPDTAAGEQADEQIAEIYYDWAVYLDQNDSYQEAVEIIALLQDKYPDAPSMDGAIDLAAKIHHDWASYLYETGDYQESINVSEIILDEYTDYFAESEIKEDIKNAYLAMGLKLRESEQYSLAILKYETFQEKYPQVSQIENIPQLIFEAHLQWGEQLIQQGEFSQALIKFTEIIELASEPDEVKTAEEGYQNALLALSKDTGTQGQEILDDAFKTACNGEPASSPAVGFAEDEPQKARSCSSELKLDKDLTAEYPGHFQYVVTISDGFETVQSCPYKQDHTLIRQRQYLLVTIRKTVTGNVFTTKKFYGSDPPKCERTEWFSGPTAYKYGTKPSISEVNTWLIGFLQ